LVAVGGNRTKINDTGIWEHKDKKRQARMKLFGKVGKGLEGKGEK